MYDKPQNPGNVDFSLMDFTEMELWAMDDLMSLWEEGNTGDDDLPISSGGHRSWCCSPPPFLYKSLLQTNFNLWAFVQQVSSEIKTMDLAKTNNKNLSPAQHKALIDL